MGKTKLDSGLDLELHVQGEPTSNEADPVTDQAILEAIVLSQGIASDILSEYEDATPEKFGFVTRQELGAAIAKACAGKIVVMQKRNVCLETIVRHIHTGIRKALAACAETAEIVHVAVTLSPSNSSPNEVLETKKKEIFRSLRALFDKVVKTRRKPPIDDVFEAVGRLKRA